MRTQPFLSESTDSTVVPLRKLPVIGKFVPAPLRTCRAPLFCRHNILHISSAPSELTMIRVVTLGCWIRGARNGKSLVGDKLPDSVHRILHQIIYTHQFPRQADCDIEAIHANSSLHMHAGLFFVVI